MQAGPRLRTGLSTSAGLLLAWITLDVAIAVYLGLDGANVISSTLLVAAVVLVALAVLTGVPSGPGLPDALPADVDDTGGKASTRVLLPVLALVAAQLVLRLLLPYRAGEPAPPGIYRLLAVVGLAALAVGTRWTVGRPSAGGPDRRFTWAMNLVILTGLLFRVAIVATDVAPTFDVHLIQIAAGQAVLHLNDPYLTHVYESGYPYLPVAAIAAAIGEVLGDARWASCLGDILTIIGILLFARRVRARPALGLAIAAVWAWWAGAPYITWQGFPEPILIGFLAMGAAAIAGATPRVGPAGIFLGLALATKQFGLGVVPFIPWHRRRWLATFIVASAVAVALLLPFIAWDPEAFTGGAFLSLITEPGRAYALNVLNWPHVSLDVPVLLGFLIAMVFGWVCSARQAGPVAPWLAGSAGLLLVAATLNKIGFVNYYAIPMALMLLWIVALERDTDEPTDLVTPVRTEGAAACAASP